MRKPMHTLILGGALLLASCGIGGGDDENGGGGVPPSVQNGAYIVTAWSELGMHCIDGEDYSVFSVLPPYNIIRAQVVRRDDRPTAVHNGITVTYEAVRDSSGSINTHSAGKTNFWTYVQALFLTAVAPEIGLTGAHTQTTTPYPMSYNAQLGYWEADGVPTVGEDDAGASKPYPMVKVVAKDSSGEVLGSVNIVVPVSDEINCGVCHASGSNPEALPSAGWENNPDPAKDMKFNILKKHDDRWDVSAQVAALKPNYQYQNSLYQTAKSGTPVLCAACHASNALGATGVAGAQPLTEAMHTLHGPLDNPATGKTLDSATNPADSCYLCHPGVQTKCQRGAMHWIGCQKCHGNLSTVGQATRRGWLDLPSCQMCHYDGSRATTTFDSATSRWRIVSDGTFATEPDVPMAGTSLYRYSTGHGGMYCSACHGSPHAEYPTLEANDNVYSSSLQGYAGKIVECTVCHQSMPSTSNGGPHGMHTVGPKWVSGHESAAEHNRAQCAYCHGADYRGTPLSALSTARTLNGKNFTAGHQISCYDCHDGPNGGD